jgi:hypothetical protein
MPSAEARGIQPVTVNEIRGFGGAERDRTVDPLLAKQVLSQLSYSPIVNFDSGCYGKIGGPG